MRKGFIVLIVLLILIVLFFIPFNQEKSVSINAPFLKVYKQLLLPRNWANWEPEVKKEFNTDSAKVAFINKPNGYSINYPAAVINVRQTASGFSIAQQGLNGDYNYLFTILPDKKSQKKTLVNVVLKTNAISYISGLISKKPFNKTGITAFKNYLENDSAYYGYNIYKVRVPQRDLLVIRKKVPLASQFMEAKKSLNDLEKFITDNHLKKMQPVIAQYIPAGLDSTQVNVGFYIDKPITSTGYVTYVSMPKGGPLVVIDYKGVFSKRYMAYAAIKRYFTDHAYQSAVAPFETYFEDKLPNADADSVYIRINFTSFQ